MSSNTNTPSAQVTQTTSTATSSAATATHIIKVGPKEDPHGYVPHELEARVGDLIVFEFWPRNHSVVQADWKAPCMPATGDYFFSGVKNDFNEPTFFYCTGIDSCIVNGMVGVINPNATQTWESQFKAAQEAPYMLLPGQPMPAEGESSGDTGTGTTTITPSSTPDPDNTTASSSSSPSHALSGGAIAGIVIGAVAFLIILCLLVFFLGRNNVYKKWISQSQEGSTTNAMRTARWALTTSAGIGAGTGKSEADTTTGISGLPVSGASPSLGHDPGSGGAPPGNGFASMEYTHPPSGIYSPPEGGYAFPSPALTPPMQVQQPQPYWIWDQNAQPFQAAGRRGAEPSELDGEGRK
ncbi:hypothetical protein BJX61DRAFT_541143 [Aspergillus egyptiacus]|nr:hypothetical protein BJX61DRAFT_541143 [Aspergillus egyptiacus]